MKKQSIKSLTSQLKELKVDGFELNDLKSGDYGYNLAYATVDGKISVAFKIPYQADDDATATTNIKDSLECDVLAVRYVASKLTPKGSSLIEYIDGENLTSMKLGLEVDGHGIYFNVPICYWVKNHPSHKPPIFYTAEERLAIIKNTAKKYVDNFKAIIDTKDFELKKYEMSNGAEQFFEHGKQKFVNAVIITGKAYGVENSFVIKNFETEKIKKRMKAELKSFKDISLGKIKRSSSQKSIDLRNYPELVEAYNKCDKLNRLLVNASIKYYDSVRAAECYNCDRYNDEKDTRGHRFKDVVDYESRFATCGTDCEKLDRVKKDMINLAKKKSDYDTYSKEVFVPAVLDLFEKTDPQFIHWRTGETLSWRELFPNTEAVLENDEVVHLCVLMNSGSSGTHIWGGNVITLRGEAVSDERKELLKLGQDPDHNIGNAYMTIRDNELTVENGKIVYDRRNDGKCTSENERLRNGTIKSVQSSIHRLTYNYAIFKKPQDKYKVNAMLAVYCSFLGDDKSAEVYKAKISELDKSAITPDEKLEALLKVI